MGDADQDAVGCAQHLARLVEDDLDMSWVLSECVGKLECARSGLDVGQAADPAL